MGLTWWMRVVGGFYLLLGALNSPPALAARLPAQYPGVDVSAGSAAARALVDTWFVFGLELAVIGVALIYLSREPTRHVGLVGTVLGLEVVRGILDDVYMIARGGDAAFYAGFAFVHLAIVLTGVAALRGLRPSSTAPAPARTG